MFLLAKMIERPWAAGRVFLILAVLVAAATVTTRASGSGSGVGGVNPLLGQRPASDTARPPETVPPQNPGP
jgi:hypothetical protein